MNGESPAWFDRFGFRRESWAGLSAMFKDAISKMGFVYSTPLDYAAGIVISLPNQVFRKDGEYYKPAATLELPYTTTGVWASESVNFVPVGDAILRTSLSAPGGAALIGFLQSGTGAVARTVEAKFKDGRLNVKDFGAVGDGATNDTAAINRALLAGAIQKKGVAFPAGYYVVDEASPGAGYALLNRGVSMYGEGALRTAIVPAVTMPLTADFIRISPTADDVLDYTELYGFLIYPAFPGSKRGRKGIYVDMTEVSNASSFNIDGVYCAPGNDYSFEWYTDPANIQGGPANSVFQRSAFWEGTRFTNHGDSNTFRNCIFRSSVGSGRPGVNTKSIYAGGGQASQTTVEQCNMDCDGGAVLALNGLKFTMRNNNIEQSHGAGTGSGAVVDFDGTEGGCAWAEFSGNSIGAFSAGAVASLVRINNAAQTKVSHNRLSSATAGNAGAAILITSLAADTIIEQNEIGTAFPQSLVDNGIGTRGVPRNLTLQPGFSTHSGSKPMAVYKSPSDGRLHVDFDLDLSGGVGSGALVTNIPSGFRYGYPTIVVGVGTSGANYIPVTLMIDATGNAVLSATAAVTRIQGSGSYGGLGFVNGNL
jgi:hypothetical protein